MKGGYQRLHLIGPVVDIYAECYKLMAVLSCQQILWDRISSLTTGLVDCSDGIKGLETMPY